jgi:hypothetical protein
MKLNFRQDHCLGKSICIIVVFLYSIYSPVSILKTRISARFVKWNLLSWAQFTEVVSIFKQRINLCSEGSCVLSSVTLLLNV